MNQSATAKESGLVANRYAGLLQRFWQRRIAGTFWLTSSGQIILAGWAVSTIVGVWTLDIPVYLFVCAWTSVIVAAPVVGYALRPRVLLRGDLPTKAVAGQALTIPFHLQNTGRRTVYDIFLGMFRLPDHLQVVAQPHKLSHVHAGDAGVLDLQFTPLKRGVYSVPPVVAYSTFPFHLCRIPAGKHPSPPLLVLPTFTPLHDVNVPIGKRYQPGGIALTSNVGESPEYIGNREYRPGDPVKHIDFRSWARLAKPVVREFQEEYYSRIALILDTYVPATMPITPSGYAGLEAAVSVTAAIADALAQGEHLIDLFAAGPELYVFRSGRHTAHFDNVLEILACVDHCRKNPFESIAPAVADELGNISTVICVLLDWDRSRELLIQAAAEARCTIKIVVIRDGETSVPISGAEAWTRDVSQFTPNDVRQGHLETL